MGNEDYRPERTSKRGLARQKIRGNKGTWGVVTMLIEAASVQMLKDAGYLPDEIGMDEVGNATIQLMRDTCELLLNEQTKGEKNNDHEAIGK